MALILFLKLLIENRENIPLGFSQVQGDGFKCFVSGKFGFSITNMLNREKQNILISEREKTTI